MYQMCKTVFFFVLFIQSLASQPCTFFTYLLKTFQTFPLLKLILIALNQVYVIQRNCFLSLLRHGFRCENQVVCGFYREPDVYIHVAGPPEGCKASLRCTGTGLVWWD